MRENRRIGLQAPRRPCWGSYEGDDDFARGDTIVGPLNQREDRIKGRKHIDMRLKCTREDVKGELVDLGLVQSRNQ